MSEIDNWGKLIKMFVKFCTPKHKDYMLYDLTTMPKELKDYFLKETNNLLSQLEIVETKRKKV